jgi:hypothetical protein
MAYGVADMLGNNTHIGKFDMVDSSLQEPEREDKCLFGIFGLLKPLEGRDLLKSSDATISIEQFCVEISQRRS